MSIIVFTHLYSNHDESHFASIMMVVPSKHRTAFSFNFPTEVFQQTSYYLFFIYSFIYLFILGFVLSLTVVFVQN